MTDLRVYWDEAKAGLDKSRSGMALILEGWCEAGIAIGKIKDSSEPMIGGTDFNSVCKKELGLSPSSCSYLIGIGGKSYFLLENSNSIPVSMKSVYQLTTLSDSDLTAGIDSGTINPNMTQADVAEYKHKLFVEKSEIKEEIRRADLSDEDREDEDKEDRIAEAKLKTAQDRAEKLKDDVKKAKEAERQEQFRKNQKEQDSLFDDIFSGLFGKSNLDKDEEAILYILREREDVKKAVVKLIKNRLHPDKDKGDAELFKKIGGIK